MFVLVVLRNEFRGTCMAAGPGLQTPHLLHCNHCIMMYHCHRMKLPCYQWIVVGVAGFLGWMRASGTQSPANKNERASDACGCCSIKTIYSPHGEAPFLCISTQLPELPRFPSLRSSSSLLFGIKLEQTLDIHTIVMGVLCAMHRLPAKRYACIGTE